MALEKLLCQQDHNYEWAVELMMLVLLLTATAMESQVIDGETSRLTSANSDRPY